jgi:Spy/CpxP family protein refolding chaperone
MKALIKASLVAVAALWAGAVLAQSPAAGPRSPASHLEKLAILLDLTDAQKPQVATILEGQHAQMKALIEQAKAAGGQPDFQALRAAHQQISQDTLAKLSGVLTPAQLKKFQTLQQMHARGFGHHGPPPGGAPAAVPQSN